jgi:uncharacterized protein YggL (DUF469 family)
MKDQKKNRTQWLHIRLTEEEHKKINAQFEKTTCRNLCEYARKILFTKPTTVLQRNESLDDFMAEMIALRNELSSIGSNFNQAVQKLHTLDHVPELKIWLRLNEGLQESFIHKTEQIKNKINQMSDQWLQ